MRIANRFSSYSVSSLKSRFFQLSPWRRVAVLAGLALGIPFVFILLLALVNIYDPPVMAEDSGILEISVNMDNSGNAFVAALGAAAPPGTSAFTAGQNYLKAVWFSFSRDERVILIPERALRFRDGSGVPCQETVGDCLPVLRRNAEVVRALAAKNAVRMKRYRELYAYPGYSDRLPKTLDFEPPDVHMVPEHGLALCEIGVAALSGQPRTALQGLVVDTFHWRKVAGGTTSLVTKVVALRHLERNYYMLSEILRLYRLSPELVRSAEPILQPLTQQERGFELPLRGELAQYAHFFRNFRSARPAAPLFGLEPAWLDGPIIAAFYKPNATVRRLIRRYEQLIALANTESTAFMQAAGFLSTTDPEWTSLWRAHYLYNPIGKTMLALSAMPSIAYAQKIAIAHDLDGLIRLVRIQYGAIQERRRDGAIAELAATFSSPYADEPIQYAMDSQTLSFIGVKDRPDRLELGNSVQIRIQ